MGTTSFEDSGWIVRKKGNKYSTSDIAPLFNDLVEHATYEYGQEYTGAINMKDDFMLCGVMTRNQYHKAKDWWYGDMSKTPPKFLRDKGVVSSWKYAEGKWEPACAVVIKDETRDAEIISGAFIKDKGVIPAKNREKNQYVVNYGKDGNSEKRVESIPDAWKWIKNQLDRDPKFRVQKIEKAYTYAKPEIDQRTKKGRKVYVEFFGYAAE